MPGYKASKYDAHLLVALCLLPITWACHGHEDFVVVAATQQSRLMYALSQRLWRQGICAVILTESDPTKLPPKDPALGPPSCESEPCTVVSLCRANFRQTMTSEQCMRSEGFSCPYGGVGFIFSSGFFDSFYHKHPISGSAPVEHWSAAARSWSAAA
eukprot:gene11750-34476_t